MTDLPGIDDVAPAGSNDGLDLSAREDLADVPLHITGIRFFPTGEYGPWYRVVATREDTGEQVAFAGATVLDKQLAQVMESGVMPPVGQGVRAMMTKIQPSGNGNAYWQFVTPQGGQSSNGATTAPASTRAADVKALMDKNDVDGASVRAFVDSLMPDAKLTDLSDEHFATLVEWLSQEPTTDEPPF